MPSQTDAFAQVLTRVRERHPVIHVISNWVTANDVASALHAIGARPIMASAPEEVEEVTSKAEALVLNLGTPTAERIEAMLLSGRRANAQGRPVLFDPVGVSASQFRIESSRRILSELRVTIIRGNQAEIGFLAGSGGELAGIDAMRGPKDLDRAAEELSRTTGAVIAATGLKDWVVTSEKRVIIENGHPVMGQVTGMGCMLTAVVGAFAAVERDPWVAAVGAIAFFGLAGEQAALRATGPGTFKLAFMDILSLLTPDQMRKGMKLKDDSFNSLF